MDPLRPKKRVGALTYPLNQEDRYETKIKFQAVKVIPPKVSGLGVRQAVNKILSSRNPGEEQRQSAADTKENAVNNYVFCKNDDM